MVGQALNLPFHIYLVYYLLVYCQLPFPLLRPHHLVPINTISTLKTRDFHKQYGKETVNLWKHVEKTEGICTFNEAVRFTLPEIQTLLDGVTIGGHKISDQQIALNQGKTWRTLFEWIEKGRFEVTAEKACELHQIAGKEEALECGGFRSGGVTIAGTEYMPPEAVMLPALFDNMVAQAYKIADIYDRAIFLFLTMARCQFFYDVNKRMGRFIMNGLLLSAGYPAINLPAKRQLEFNQLMLAFYSNSHFESKFS